MHIPIKWSERALLNLKSIEEYISLNSELRARKTIQDLISYVSLLAISPEMGSPVKELFEFDLRLLVKYEYKIIYQVTDESVLIIAIIHSKQDFVSRFLSGK
jgi:plasmid stabilization system protein ParE